MDSSTSRDSRPAAPAAPRLATTPDQAYAELCAAWRTAMHFRTAFFLGERDRDRLMPPLGAPLRAGYMGQMDQYERGALADHRVGQWIETVRQSAMTDDPTVAATLQVMQREHARARAVPDQLIADLAAATGAATAAWVEARRIDRFAPFAQPLAHLVGLKQDEAAALAAAPGAIELPPSAAAGPVTAADILLAAAEPGITLADVHRLNTALARALGALTTRVLDAAERTPTPLANVTVAPDRHDPLMRTLLTAWGLDPAWLSVETAGMHPMTWRLGPGDVRLDLAARDVWFGSFLAPHETAHASVSHHRDSLTDPRAPATENHPLHHQASQAIEEGIACLLEDGIARRRSYWTWFGPQLLAALAPSPAIAPDVLWRESNRPSRARPRARCDTLTLWIHNTVWTEMDAALTSGTLPAADVPGAWNDRVEALLGIRPKGVVDGACHLPHWARGAMMQSVSYDHAPLIGAQLLATLVRQVPDLDAHLARGNFEPVQAWLRRITPLTVGRTAREFVFTVTGSALSPEAYVAQLHARYESLF